MRVILAVVLAALFIIFNVNPSRAAILVANGTYSAGTNHIVGYFSYQHDNVLYIEFSTPVTYPFYALGWVNYDGGWNDFCEYEGRLSYCGGNDVPGSFSFTENSPTQYSAELYLSLFSSRFWYPYNPVIYSQWFLRYCCQYEMFFHAAEGGNYKMTLAIVPEPATWALMILGIGAIGFAMRGQRPVARGKVQYSISYS